MKPPPFRYHDPRTVGDAVALLGSLENAKLLAGGQSLMPMLNFRFVQPDHIIDLNRVEGLSYIREDKGALAIGAMTRQRDLEFSDVVRARWPIMHEALLQVGHRQTRNRGTIGGSLCQADAAEDLSAVCVAAKGKAVIRGAGGERVVGLHEFHIGPYMTVVGDGEMLTEVRLPLRPGAGSAHEKVERRAGDWAIAAASAVVWMHGGTIADAGLALSAVGPTTVHVSRAEELLRGKAPSDELFEQAGEIASEDCAPLPDGRGPVDYKRHLAGVLTKRALRRAAARALHQEG